MAELESSAALRGQQPEKLLQQRGIFPQRGRKLKKPGSQPALQRFRGVHEPADEIRGRVAPAAVGDRPRRFKSEKKMRRHLFRPGLQRRSRGEAVKGTVDLD